MPVHTRWISEGHIFAVHFTGTVGVVEMRDAIIACLNALDMAQVSFLLDFSEAGAVMPDALQLSTLGEWIYHPNARWFAYANANGVLKVFAQMHHRGSAQMFRTTAEAEAFLLKKLT